jgi:hypothetical protein
MYFDGNSDLDKSRAINQSNWAQQEMLLVEHYLT